MIIKPVKKITVTRPVIAISNTSQDSGNAPTNKSGKIIYYKNWQFYVINLALFLSIIIAIASLSGGVNNSSVIIYFLFSILFVYMGIRLIKGDLKSMVGLYLTIGLALLIEILVTVGIFQALFR